MMASVDRGRAPSWRSSRMAATLVVAAVLAGCASYGERVAPVPLPESQANYVEVDGAKVVGRALVDPAAAKKAFGFDIRGAGLLPVRLVIDNQSAGEIHIEPTQTFLVDDKGQAWPLLTQDLAYRRIKSHVELGETAKGTAKTGVLGAGAGLLVGAAIAMVTGENAASTIGKAAGVGAAAGMLYGGAQRNQQLDDRIRDDLMQESLGNQAVPQGGLAYGYLFFPGQDEAQSAQELRLSMNIAGIQRIVKVPLSGD
jgi:hypothetical protein